MDETVLDKTQIAAWVEARVTGHLPDDTTALVHGRLTADDAATAALAAATAWAVGSDAPGGDSVLRTALVRKLTMDAPAVRAAVITTLAERAAWGDDTEALAELSSLAWGRLAGLEALALATAAALVAAHASGDVATELVRELLKAVPRSDASLLVPVAHALLRLPERECEALLPAAEAVAGMPAALLDVTAELELPDLLVGSTLLGVLSRELDRRGDAQVLRLLATRDIKLFRPQLIRLLKAGPVPRQVAAARIAARLALENATAPMRELFGGLSADGDRLVVADALLRLGSADGVGWLAEAMDAPTAPRVDMQTVARAVDTGALDLNLLGETGARRYALERTAVALARKPTRDALVTFLDAIEAAPPQLAGGALEWMWRLQRGALVVMLGEEAAATIDGASSPVPGVAERADRLVDLLGALLHSGHIDEMARTPFGLLNSIAADTGAAPRVRHRALLAMLRGGERHGRSDLVRDLVAALAPVELDGSIRDEDAPTLLAGARLCPAVAALTRVWLADPAVSPAALTGAATALLDCDTDLPAAVAAARRATAQRGDSGDYRTLARAAAAAGDAALSQRASRLQRRAAWASVTFPAPEAR